MLARLRRMLCEARSTLRLARAIRDGDEAACRGELIAVYAREYLKDPSRPSR